MSPEPHLPTALGLDALAELDEVDWSSLTHAYGEGRLGSELAGDVAGSLALIAHDVRTAVNEGLYSNVCHQGTVYEASAYALPFLGAVAAGDVPSATRAQLVTLFADIAVGGSHVTVSGSNSGAFGAGVDQLIRTTIARCDGFLGLIAEADSTWGPLIAAIRRLTANPSAENRDAVLQLIDPAE